MKPVLCFFLLASVIAGDAQQGPALRIGHRVEKVPFQQTKVGGGTHFVQGDSVHFVYSQPDPVGTPELLFQIALLQSGQYRVVSSQRIAVDPRTRQVMGHYAARNLIRRFGYGHFQACIMKGGNVLAMNTFTLSPQSGVQ